MEQVEPRPGTPSRSSRRRRRHRRRSSRSAAARRRWAGSGSLSSRSWRRRSRRSSVPFLFRDPEKLMALLDAALCRTPARRPAAQAGSGAPGLSRTAAHCGSPVRRPRSSATSRAGRSRPVPVRFVRWLSGRSALELLAGTPRPQPAATTSGRAAHRRSRLRGRGQGSPALRTATCLRSHGPVSPHRGAVRRLCRPTFARCCEPRPQRRRHGSAARLPRATPRRLQPCGSRAPSSCACRRRNSARPTSGSRPRWPGRCAGPISRIVRTVLAYAD